MGGNVTMYSEQHLDRLVEGILPNLAGSPQVLADAERRFAELKRTYSQDVVSHCLGEFATAELDHQTEGVRGLGRISEDVPRLGGLLREEIAALSASDQLLLHGLISDVLLGGYLAPALFMDVAAAKPRMTDAGCLFELWIPGIYSGNPGALGRGFFDVLLRCSGPSIQAALEFIVDSAEVAPSDPRGDTLQKVFTCYAVAGSALRYAEVTGKSAS